MTNYECGCPEYQSLSRRRFLGVGGASAAALASAPAWLPKVAFAKDYRAAQRDVLVTIFLRGAADGMSMCVPFGEPNYYASRPTLNVPRPDSSATTKAINLDGFFGLAPALSALKAPYDDGKLLIVHATGLDDPTRSHFDAQRFMELGKPHDLTLATGWVGRHLLSTAPVSPGSALRAMAFNTGLPTALLGAPQTLPIPDPANFGLDGSSITKAARLTALDNMYDLVADPLKAAADTTMQTIAVLDAIDFAGYVPADGAVYPSGYYGAALRASAALIKAQVGVEAISIDVSGWDTHNAQGPLTGVMASLMTILGNGLGAFYTDVIHSTAPDTSVAVVSEFGRRLQENGSLGTDHGHGNVMWVMGRCVAGGRVLTQWPGLSTDKLFEGKDLQVTIDYRDILAEIVQKRLGNPALDYVFPGYTPKIRGALSC